MKSRNSRQVDFRRLMSYFSGDYLELDRTSSSDKKKKPGELVNPNQSFESTNHPPVTKSS